MNFMIAAHSDVGIKKRTNQDSLLLKIAQTNLGKVCLCVMCDGMGGLSKGELASATVIRVMEQWFENTFPDMIKKGFSWEDVKLQWDNIVLEQNQSLNAYAAKNGTRMGTTIVALLIVGDRYFVMNIGDSRAYILKDRICQITKDQSFVQYEMDAGRLTEEEARVHPQRNVLLQCVGASDVVTPDFYEGTVAYDSVFMLCSDGFRHIITPDEIYAHLCPRVSVNEQMMREQIVWLTELNKQRGEADNISVAVIKTCREG